MVPEAYVSIVSLRRNELCSREGTLCAADAQLDALGFLLEILYPHSPKGPDLRESQLLLGWALGTLDSMREAWAARISKNWFRYDSVSGLLAIPT